MSLCSKCQTLPLDVQFARQTSHHLETRRWHKENARIGCPFCLLILAVSEFQDGDDDAKLGLTRIKDGFVPGIASDNPLKDFGDPIIVPFVMTLPNGPAIGHGQRLPPIANMTRMTRWYEQCRENENGKHDECKRGFVWRTGAGGSDQEGLQKLRLLDIQNRCMAKFDRADGVRRRYAVLSYVIGGTDLPAYDRHEMKEKQTYNSVDFAKLPQVYRDAIAVANGVGLRYLWIDAMCLLNKGAGDYERDDHQRGIDNMDRIYEGASLTICAAEHKNADGRLSALNGTGRHRRRAIDEQKMTTVPSGSAGRSWGVIRGLYSRLRDTRYMERGWTYQELVLSHRCLIFTAGMAFFRCRKRLYSEDTFWEQSDDQDPSPGIMTYPYETAFLPKDGGNDDSWAWYADNLQQYSIRQLSLESDTINAFKGILNRICHSQGTQSLAGMPQSMLDMALVWYHRPDMASVWYNRPGIASELKREPVLTIDMPSWSWAAWTGIPVSTWVPGVEALDRQKWMDKHGGHIEYWYTDPNGNNIKRADTNAQPNYWAPSAAFPPSIHAQFLQFMTYTSQGFILIEESSSHEIRTTQNDVIGIVYVDGGTLDYSNPRFTLAQLNRAPKGDSTFDYGDGLALSAKNQDLRWVLLLAWKGGDTYRRVGLGYIHENKLGCIVWSSQKQWVALY